MMEVRDLKMFLWVMVWTLVSVSNVQAQDGFRSAQLTAPKIPQLDTSTFFKNDSKPDTSLFSKWTGMDLSHRRGQPGGIESELAAIFRGVAYGVTTKPPPQTLPPTTTTTTTTTTTATTPRPVSKIVPSVHYSQASSDFQSFSESPIASIPNLETMSPLPVGSSPSPQDPPIQYPYLEAPEVRTQFNEESDVKPTSSITDIQVVWSDMSDVKWVQALGVAWVVHVYIAAALYSILVVLAIFWLAKVNAKVHLLPHGYYITLHLLMFLAAFLRCVHLFHDPYGAEQRLPQPLSQAVEETAWPCLTAAVGVVVMAIVRAWQCPRIIPKRNLAPIGLALITAVHLVIALTAHLVTAVVPEQASPLRAAARAVTVAWGGTVGLVGLVATWRVANGTGRYSSQLHMRFNRTTSVNSHLRNPRMALIHGTRLALVACLAQITMTSLHLYALVGPHYLLDIPPVYPWQWMAYQSSARTLEIITWVLLGAISAINVGGYQNKYSSPGEARLLTVLGCHCCGSSTSIATQEKLEDMYPTMCQTNHALRNYTLQSYGKGTYQDSLGDPMMRRTNTGCRPNDRSSIRKSATSDMAMLWNNGNGPVNLSSRPSSLLFNDSGFIRFKMQGNNDEMSNSLQNLDLICHDNNLNTKKKLLLQQTENQAGSKIYSDNPPPYENSLMSPEIAQKLCYGSPEKFENRLHESQMENLLQNRINAQLYSGLKDFPGNQSEVRSTTDYSSTDNRSPPPQSDADWSKYASNCSSISATTSFDVRMFDEFEVGNYYQNPSCASSHTYASLQRPSLRGQNSLQKQTTMNKNLSNEIPPHSYNSKKAAEQFTSLLTPYISTKDQHVSNNYYMSGCMHDHNGYGSDSDIYSSSNGRCTQLSQDDDSSSPGPRRINNSRRVNIHDVTPDSGLAVDYSGNTDETSGDDAESTPSSTLPNNHSGLFSKIVKNNFSRNNAGYTPLDTEDLFIYQQLHKQQREILQTQEERHHSRTIQTAERVRPCGHRPRRGRHSDIKTRYDESPLVNASRPLTYSFIQYHQAEKNNVHQQNQSQSENAQLKLKQQYLQHQINQKRKEQKEKLGLKMPLNNQSLVSPNSPLKDIATIFEDHEDQEVSIDQPADSVTSNRIPSPLSSRAVSPTSTRPASSVASHSDLHSECVDSDDYASSGSNTAATSEDETTLQISPLETWPPPARLISQQPEISNI